MEIAREWARYEPSEARQWASAMPIFTKYGDAFTFGRIPSQRPSLETLLCAKPRKEGLLERPKSDSPNPTIGDLKKLARPGAPPIANARIYQHIFSLDLPTTKHLIHSLTKRPLANAREILVRRYLLESWILFEPAKACDWILESGDGRMRTLLPLAFRHMGSQETLKLEGRLNKIPETDVYERCLRTLESK